MAGRARALKDKDKANVSTGVADTLSSRVNSNYSEHQGAAEVPASPPSGGTPGKLGPTGLAPTPGGNQKGFGDKRAQDGINIGQLRSQDSVGSIIEPFTIGPGVEGDQVGARGERRASLVGNADQALKKFR